MFEYLKKYDKILVTGPQRSGTRICAKMIAHDTGHRFLDESVAGSSFAAALSELSKGSVVIHGPMMSSRADLFDDDVLIVFMIRDKDDIETSEKRIGWHGSSWGEFNERPRYNAVDTKMPISEIKYFIWKHLQRGRIKNSIEVMYDSLSPHPLWKDKKDRAYFKSNQME